MERCCSRVCTVNFSVSFYLGKKVVFMERVSEHITVHFSDLYLRNYFSEKIEQFCAKRIFTKSNFCAECSCCGCTATVFRHAAYRAKSHLCGGAIK